MDVAALLLDLYGRVPPLAREAVEGLDTDALTTAPRDGANPIGWLLWHIARVQDASISELMDEEQLWVTGDWAPRFGLEPDPANMGYGHGPADVAAVQPRSAADLLAYLDAADARTRAFIEPLRDADLDRIVDERWDPPVSLGVRLISVADDCAQHVGQAGYVRGLLVD
jgi:uncharacterized damage-inducible protein DinB